MTLIKLVLSNESSELLQVYLAQQKIPGKKAFHSTLIYTEESPIFQTEELTREIESLLPITLDQTTYSLALFGKSELVLAYRDNVVSNINQLLVLAALRQSIGAYQYGSRDERIKVLERHQRIRTSPVYDFNPHITLANFFQGGPKSILTPEFPIILAKLDWEVNH